MQPQKRKPKPSQSNFFLWSILAGLGFAAVIFVFINFFVEQSTPSYPTYEPPALNFRGYIALGDAKTLDLVEGSDMWLFRGEQGMILTIEIDTESADFAPSATIYDTREPMQLRTLLREESTTDHLTASVELPANDEYSILVRSANAGGTYTIQIR